MSAIRNLLALIGLLAIVALVYVWVRFEPDIRAFQKLDTNAAHVYMDLWDQLKTTGNAAEATVWKFPVEEDIGWEDVEQAMRSGGCELVLAWAEQATGRQLRRLQLAAEEGETAGILFRPPAAIGEPSSASLRLKLSTATENRIDIVKSRGGRPASLPAHDLIKRPRV